jgi:hypothetical protein
VLKVVEWIRSAPIASCSLLSFCDSIQHMQKMTEIAITKAVRGVFTREEAACWIDADGARLDALLKRAVAVGEVLRIRRGLFCLSKRYTSARPHPFELAQRIHGPSYISLESALSHHGWIPESVPLITSVTQARSRSFDTPLGLFSFTSIPQDGFFTGVHRETHEGGGSFFMAGPLKALADYVYAHRCTWSSIAPAIESLRIDETELTVLTSEACERLSNVYRSGRVRRFLEGLQKELRS